MNGIRRFSTDSDPTLERRAPQHGAAHLTEIRRRSVTRGSGILDRQDHSQAGPCGKTVAGLSRPVRSCPICDLRRLAGPRSNWKRRSTPTADEGTKTPLRPCWGPNSTESLPLLVVAANSPGGGCALGQDMNQMPSVIAWAGEFGPTTALPKLTASSQFNPSRWATPAAQSARSGARLMKPPQSREPHGFGSFAKTSSISEATKARTVVVCTLSSEPRCKVAAAADSSSGAS